MKQLDANTLVAYVDGELDIETASLVEARLLEDTEAREITGKLRDSASLIRAAHNHVLHEAVPDRLLDVFETVLLDDEFGGGLVPAHLVNMILQAPEGEDAAFTPAVVKSSRETAFAPAISMARRRSVAAFATAAVFASVLVGGGMMVQRHMSALNQAGTSRQAIAVAAMDDPWREAAFQEALETRKSEAAVIWANPENGRSGAFVPVKTYRRDDGTFCRAFRVVDTGASRDQPNYGVACREPGDEGRWVKAVEAVSASGAGGKMQF